MALTIRSFIAFDIEDLEVLNKLSQAQDKLVGSKANLKLVKPVNIHITMRFLGEINLKTVDSIYVEMTNLKFTPFNVVIKGLGVFPSFKYPRVVWAGIKEGSEQLERIYNDLNNNLQVLGFKHTQKSFSPHITIARVRTGRKKAELAQCIKGFVDYSFGDFSLHCLKLKKSILTPKGPIYSTLKEVGR